MKDFVNHIKHLDWIIIVSSLVLVGIGLLSLYSSSLSRGDFENFLKQLIFLLVGVFVMLAVSFVDYRLFRNNSYLLLFLYAAGVAALAGLFIFAPEIRGIQGWYKVGSISVDPIEYMKIILIMLIAKYLSSRHTELYRIQHIFLSGFYFAIPVLLIFFQPDLGSALLLSGLWLLTMLISGIRLFHFVAIIFAGLLIFSLGWTFVLQDYQQDRIISFIEPELDPLGTGWSQLQTKIAIGNGALFGRGIGQGTQTQYGFLSEPQTDFIFAAIAEEFGLLGITLLLLSFLLLIWRMLRVGLHAGNNFSRLFVSGFAILLGLQALINIGMNVGALPIIGLSFPLAN